MLARVWWIWRHNTCKEDDIGPSARYYEAITLLLGPHGVHSNRASLTSIVKEVRLHGENS